MESEQEEKLKWECIPKRAQNWMTPEESDGYNENEVYQAVNKMYEKCKEMWKEDAEKYRVLVETHKVIY